MKTPSPLHRSPSLLVSCLLLSKAVLTLNAGTFGVFTYSDDGLSITITDCDYDASVASIPSSIAGKPVTTIGANAFYSSEITRVTIPTSVIAIEAGAFSNSGLRSVTIPASITKIENSVFEGCEDLTSVTIPSSVVSIGDSAFSSCWYLPRVIIPLSVTSIGDGAFYDCWELSSVTIPASVTHIGSGAFSGCDSLKAVTIGSSALLDGTFIDCDYLTSVTFLGNAPPIINSPFAHTNTDLRIYYLDGKKGFTWPKWNGYKSTPLGAEITVEQPFGSPLTDNVSKKSFGTVTLGKSRSRTFLLRNIGTSPLEGLSVIKDGTHAKDFTVKKPQPTTLQRGESTTFEVIFKPSVKGTRTAALHIKSNDGNENPFDIRVIGLGVK